MFCNDIKSVVKFNNNSSEIENIVNNPIPFTNIALNENQVSTEVDFKDNPIFLRGNKGLLFEGNSLNIPSVININVYFTEHDDNQLIDNGIITKLTWKKIGKDIDGEAQGDYSGFSVSLSSDGNRVAIGSYLNDNINGIDSGSVRVYEYKGKQLGWKRLGKGIYGEKLNDQSGFSVSLSSDGNRVAIGAIFNDDNNRTDVGHVRVYEYKGEDIGWKQIGKDIDGEKAFDYSGWSVSLSNDGKRVAIGALENDGYNSKENSGHVRVYEYKSEVEYIGWKQLGQDIDGEALNDQSGSSVSLSSDGNRVAIGAIFNDGDNSNNSGHVRVYEFDGITWKKLGEDIDGENEDDFFGSSVSLSRDGNRVAIGAIFNDGDNNNNSGHVRVYEFDGTSWIQLDLDIDGENEGDISGVSVSLNSVGNRIVIGANLNDNTNGINSGHARVYEYM